MRIRDNRETTINFDDALFGKADEVVLRAKGYLSMGDAFLIA